MGTPLNRVLISQHGVKSRGAYPLTPFVVDAVLGMGELRIGTFSYEAGELSEAFLRQVPLQVLQARTMFSQSTKSGRRMAHSFDSPFGALEFTTHFSGAGDTTFHIAMDVQYGANKSSDGIKSYFEVSSFAVDWNAICFFIDCA